MHRPKKLQHVPPIRGSAKCHWPTRADFEDIAFVAGYPSASRVLNGSGYTNRRLKHAPLSDTCELRSRTRVIGITFWFGGTHAIHPGFGVPRALLRTMTIPIGLAASAILRCLFVSHGTVCDFDLEVIGAASQQRQRCRYHPNRSSHTDRR